MANVYIELQRVGSSADQIRTQAEGYRKLANQLMDTVEHSTGWYGADAEAFRNQMLGFQDNLDNMVKLMEVYASILEQTVKGYRQIQDAASAEAKRLW